MPDDNPGAEAGTERPSWLPEKFESPEAMAEAYANAERKISEQGQQLSALNENYSSLSSQFEQFTQEQQQQYQQAQFNPQDMREQLLVNYENDPLGVMAAIASQAAAAAVQQYQPQWEGQVKSQQEAQAELLADYAVSALRQTHEDFSDLEPQIEQRIAAEPALQRMLSEANTPQSFGGVLNTVYNMVKADQFREQAATQQANAGTLMKEQAQTMQGAGVRPLSPDAAQAEWDKIKAAAPPSYY